MPGLQRLRDQQEAAQGMPGVPLRQVPGRGHAEGGGAVRQSARGKAEVQEDQRAGLPQ